MIFVFTNPEFVLPREFYCFLRILQEIIMITITITIMIIIITICIEPIQYWHVNKSLMLERYFIFHPSLDQSDLFGFWYFYFFFLNACFATYLWLGGTCFRVLPTGYVNLPQATSKFFLVTWCRLGLWLARCRLLFYIHSVDVISTW